MHLLRQQLCQGGVFGHVLIYKVRSGDLVVLILEVLYVILILEKLELLRLHILFLQLIISLFGNIDQHLGLQVLSYIRVEHSSNIVVASLGQTHTLQQCVLISQHEYLIALELQMCVRFILTNLDVSIDRNLQE
jgi:hypothetical protein